jgi:mono/diheme cytochrome c family protein
MRSPAYYVTLLLLAFTSEATFAADAGHGSALAQRWCASCHVISSAQRVEIDHSPSFASIAQRPDFNAEKLAFFLLEPHPKMPDMSLSRKEADDLAAYIAEQRRCHFVIGGVNAQGLSDTIVTQALPFCGRFAIGDCACMKRRSFLF